jgi:hypothetical protein
MKTSPFIHIAEFSVAIPIGVKARAQLSGYKKKM